MTSKKIITPVEPGKIYHIYNRGSNYQDVFFIQSDYQLFLDKIAEYLYDFCSIYAYVLIPNHYHLLLRANDDLDTNEFSKQFQKLVLSYTNKINWREKRNGSLFLSHFRRIHVNTEEYLKRLIFYIHYNPVKHEMVNELASYRYSSYGSKLSKKDTKLARTEVINLFENIDGFKSYHEFLHDELKIKKYILEDD